MDTSAGSDDLRFEFRACPTEARTALADILPGFALAEKGGVVKLADLQAQDWIYLRP